jgi:molecular chaperone GrpE (heat shock protein)
MNFWKKNEKVMKSEEFEELSKKITSLEAQIETLRHKYIMQDTEILNIRNRVIKKLRALQPEEEEKPKNINSNPFCI